MFNDFVGQKLNGRYEIQARLGAGGVGLVFSAYDHTLDRQVAIKIIKPEHAWSLDGRDTFIQEARIIARLDHPHILNIYDLGTASLDGTSLVYLVVQLASDQTLADRIRSGALAPDETERILKQVCAALDYAHSRGVIHLDLKPHNILFDEHGHALVADFGLAKLLTASTHIKADTGIGTLDYMSPEQLFGGDVGPSSDVYALGITLYQMLSGELPKRRLQEDGPTVEVKRSLPPGVQPVIERATQSNALRRYPTAGKLSQALAAALNPPSSDLLSLRDTLRNLGQYCEMNPGLDGEEVATYAFHVAGLFSALGYGLPGDDPLLTHQQSDVILCDSTGHATATITFTSPECPPQIGLEQLRQRYVASLLPDVGVLCNGREMWIHHRAETDLYQTPTIRLHLKDAVIADVQAVYLWLKRRGPDSPIPYPLDSTSPVSEVPRAWRSWAWRIGAAALLLLIGITIVSIVSQQEDTDKPENIVPAVALRTSTDVSPAIPTAIHSATPTAIRPTTTPSRTPAPSPAPTFTPTSAPTPTAIPTPSPRPEIQVSDEQLTVYVAPGENYAPMGRAHRGDRLALLGRMDNGLWWQVDYLGRMGWIMAQLAGISISADLLPVITPPVMPTVTPSPSPTSTPLPTATSFPVCGLVPLGDFKDVWLEELTRARLGCLIGPAHSTGSAYATFEHGLMYWREDKGLIFAIYNNGRWSEFVDTWQEGEPHSTGLSPPPGLLEPVRGLGKIWREQLGGPDATIGWATMNEIGGDTWVADFERGVILKIGATVYLLYYDTMTWQPYSPGVGTATTSARPSLRLAFVLGSLEDAGIWIVDADGSNLRELIDVSGDQSEPDWSPSSQRIVYQSNQADNYDIWVISANGQDQQSLTAADVDEWEPEWSPDGQKVIYRHGGERNHDGELWVMEADGSDQHPLGGQHVLGRAPTWSPQGEQVAFMSEQSGTWDIYIYDLSNNQLRRLTDCSAHCRFPAWSLDGQYITYNISAGVEDLRPLQVWQVPVRGDGTPWLLIEGNNPGRPTFSQQGLVAFNSNEGIEVMNADGSGRYTLPNTEEGWAPDWSH